VFEISDMPGNKRRRTVAKHRTHRKVSKKKSAAKKRAHGRPVYKVTGGWAVGKAAKRHRKRRR
jgi:hypothetical protein